MRFDRFWNFIIAAKVSDNIVGWVGIKNGRTVTGWVADKDDLNAVQRVIISAGNWVSQPIAATEYRDHLRQRNFGTAKYGFTVDLPEDLELLAGQEILVSPIGYPNTRFKCRAMKPLLAKSLMEQGMTAPGVLQIIADGGLPWRRDLKKVESLEDFADKVLNSPKLANLLRDAGRALAQRGRNDLALRLFGAALQLNAGDSETIFRYGVAASRLNLHEEALFYLRKLHPGDWRPAKVLSELAQALRKSIELSSHQPDYAMIAEFEGIVRARLVLDKADEGILPSSIATALARFGEFELALEAIEHTITLQPQRADAHVTKARLLIENRRVGEAMDTARYILETWPDNKAAAHMIRVYRHMADVSQHSDTIAFLEIGSDELPMLRFHDGSFAGPIRTTNELQVLAESGAFNWILVNRSNTVCADEFKRCKRALVSKRAAGCILLSDKERLWRATAIGDVLEAELADIGTLTRDLAALERFYVRPAPDRTPGRAIVASRYGAARFGGAEHFLYSAACCYAEMGYRPLLLGDADKKSLDRLPKLDPPLEYTFSQTNAVALRRLIVREDVTLVHSLSGMGLPLASALGDMNVPFIYGVHFFRETFGGTGSEVYFSPDGEPIPNTDFAFLLSRASTVYANSTYTRDLIEKAHGVRCPVIFSVPDELNP